MYKGILIYILANSIGWFNLHLQFLSKWWADRPILTVFLFSFPIGYLFIIGTRYIVDGAGYYWASKLVGFSVSTIVYAFFTWLILKESFLEPKTLTCLSLCCVVIAIQIIWK
jgi:hypothetical protein